MAVTRIRSARSLPGLPQFRRRSGLASRVGAEVVVRPKRRSFQAYRSFFKRYLLSTVTNTRRASSSLDSREGGCPGLAVYILGAKPQCQVGHRQAIDFHPPGLPTLHHVTSRKRTAADEISGE